VQLKEEGRLVAVIRDEVPGKAYRFTKSEGQVSGVPHFDAEAKPLPGFASEPCFVF
jgi:protein-L-isoaspartate O-methyltransferase